jgi:3-hydroxyisobutyrate dehydrogenase-like beta-hydroxyacid dehydrogenase
MARIGFLGLGAMGLPMEKRLCAAGHEVRVTVHRDPRPAEKIVAAGGTRMDDVAGAVAGAEYVISILPEDAQIEATLLAPTVMEAIGKETIIIEMTSSTPAMMQRLAEAYAGRGVRCFDAPVSGGIAGARDGKLTIMAGGDAAVLEAVRPILDVLAAKIYLVGGVGAGKALKAVNQLIAATNAVVVAEALELARSQGIDLDMMYEVVSASSGNSYTFVNKFNKMVNDDFATGFKLSLMKKDMRIALSGAADLSMPVTSLAYQMFQMLDDGARDLDFSVVSRVYGK